MNYTDPSKSKSKVINAAHKMTAYYLNSILCAPGLNNAARDALAPYLAELIDIEALIVTANELNWNREDEKAKNNGRTSILKSEILKPAIEAKSRSEKMAAKISIIVNTSGLFKKQRVQAVVLIKDLDVTLSGWLSYLNRLR